MTSAIGIDEVTGRSDRRFGYGRFDEPGHEQSVVDFYRSLSSTFFAAVVSSCVHGPACRSRSAPDPCPTLVTLLGELDLSTAPVLGECFARLSGSIEVDCSGLDDVVEEGLGLFASAVERTDAHFVFLDPNSSLSKMTRITGRDATGGAS
jgi:anti-anti-sigma regulatory factor